MLVTAELRLWWPYAPREVERLFESQSEPRCCDCTERTDIYLLDPDQKEIGIKLRNDGSEPRGTEVKLLVAQLGEVSPYAGELWTKAASARLSLDGLPTVKVHKKRRLLRFRTDGHRAEDLGQSPGLEDPADGCDVEFTQARRDNDPARWWTLGFEAYGSLGSVERSLTLTLDKFLPRVPQEVVLAAIPGSYPLWLSGLSGTGR